MRCDRERETLPCHDCPLEDSVPSRPETNPEGSDSDCGRHELAACLVGSLVANGVGLVASKLSSLVT